MKTCTQCGITKPLTDYYKAKHHRDGHQSICKACSNQNRKKHGKLSPKEKIQVDAFKLEFKIRYNGLNARDAFAHAVTSTSDHVMAEKIAQNPNLISDYKNAIKNLPPRTPEEKTAIATNYYRSKNNEGYGRRVVSHAP